MRRPFARGDVVTPRNGMTGVIRSVRRYQNLVRVELEVPMQYVHGGSMIGVLRYRGTDMKRDRSWERDFVRMDKRHAAIWKLMH